MITDSIGKQIVGAQDEIRALRQQLEYITQKNMSQDQGEVIGIYNRLQYLIEKFESSITNNVDKVLNQAMGKSEQNPLQKLPQINTRDNDSTICENILLKTQNFHHRAHSSDNSFVKYEKQHNKTSFLLQRKDYRKEPIHTPNHVGNKNQELLQSGALQKHLFKYENQNISPYIQNLIQTNNYQKAPEKVEKAYKKRINRPGRISKPAQVLPPEIRNNPFADSIPITESEINQGLYNLINKGVVPKDVDILPAFERGVPPFIQRQVNLRGFQEKMLKQDISMNNRFDLTNIKVDIRPSFIKQRTMSYHVPSQQQKMMDVNVKVSDLSQDQHIIATQTSKNKQLDLEKLDPRAYPDLLDTYSLHHIMCRKFKIVEDSPEFSSFKRTYTQQWGQIQAILREIEKITEQHNINLIYIDGKKVVKLTEKMKKPSNEELIACVVDNEELRKLMKLPQKLSDNAENFNYAATKIQARIRCFLRQQEYYRVRQMMKKVKIIQNFAKLYIEKKNTKQVIREKNEVLYKSFMDMTEKLRKDWHEIKVKKRVEIHINSFSYDEFKRLTMNKHIQRENIQITRIFNIKDPNLTIIYVCPFAITEDITSYYFKILELGEVSQYRDRLIFIKPENCERFPSHFSLTKKLLYSPQALKRIKNIIKNRPTYIVPGFPSNDDVKLANFLKVPLMQGDPQKSFIYSSKSSAKRMAQNLGIPTPIGALEIYDETEFLNTLTVLIANNKDINTWIFKIDDEFQGRGIATFSIDSINKLKEIIEKNQNVDQNFILEIKSLIQTNIQSKISINMKSLYRDYGEYIKHFTKRGGIIEALPNTVRKSVVTSPSVSLFIAPDGKISNIFSYEKVSQNYTNFACSFPQNSLNFEKSDIMEQVQKIANEIYVQGVYGYITLDFIVYPDYFSQEMKHQFIGLDCFLNQFHCSYFYFDYLSGGKIDENTQKYWTGVQDNTFTPAQSSRKKAIKQAVESRSYFYCPFINHPGLVNVQIKNFFQMCRLESVSFDLEKKFGSTFILSDILQACVVGLLTIGEDLKSSLKLFNNALNFLMKQAGPISKDIYQEYTFGDSRIDEINIMDILSKVRLLNKKYEQNLTTSDFNYE